MLQPAKTGLKHDAVEHDAVCNICVFDASLYAQIGLKREALFKF